jgi:penicillin amidase
MKLLTRVVGWTLALLAAIVLVGGGGGYLWLRRALPQTSGSLQVTGLGAPVQIVRDVDGVPHIRAQSEPDALFGLGYAHAQDRLWQMEFQRRIANGRLSEVFGEGTLETDTFLRTLGVARAARSALENLAPDARASLEAYAAGVNAFVAGHRGRLPVEFSILGVTPEPWRPEDSLAWAKMMAWDLGGNWSEEIMRVRLEAALGAQAAAELMPAYTPDGPLILPDGGDAVGLPPGRPTTAGVGPAPLVGPAPYERLLRIGRSLEHSFSLGGELIGSNNWVVAGSRSASGKPLLADDPHLGARIPSIWYLAHISGGPIDAIGATLPGLPGVVIGHNARIAWGVTNTGPDVQDLFVERVNARNEIEYQGRWEPLTIIPETIVVKGADEPVELFVRVGRHGPLISDVTEGTGQPLAFRWTALDPTDATLEAFLGMNRAQSWAEFTAALRGYHAPMQNFVYADVDGNIGYYAPGALPIRPLGDGTRPAEGWSGAYDWAGYVPFEQLPHDLNPERGYIVSANNRVAPDSYPYLISTDWAAPYRAARITELIEARPTLSADDMAAIQADVVSLQARQLLPYLTTLQPAGERERAAVELLKGWDGTMAGESAAAAVYAAAYHALPELLFADELRGLYESDYLGRGNAQSMVIADVMAGRTVTPWCDDVNTAAAESCDLILEQALAHGLDTMAAAQGSADLRAWRWDKAHRVIFPHDPFENVGALRPLFSRSAPNGGDTFTVNVGPIRRSELYKQYNVPSYRQIVDMADLDASRFMHTTGQSGQALSGEYANLIERWQRVEYLPMRFGQAAVDAAAAGTLTLTP